VDGIWTLTRGTHRVITAVVVCGQLPPRRARRQDDGVTSPPLIVAAVGLCRTFGEGHAAVHALVDV
jgi:hypothetical protein